MTTTQENRDAFSVGEIKSQLDNLPQADWIRLERAANALCWGLAIEGQDLLNEMFCRTLEGKRTCPTNVQIRVFLIHGMKSIVSAYLKKRNYDALEQAIMANSNDLEDACAFLNQQHHMDNPEEILLAEHTLQEFEKLFIGNEKAQMVLMGQAEGHSPQEIQEIWGMDPVEYASALRFIRRKLEKISDKESSQ